MGEVAGDDGDVDHAEVVAAARAKMLECLKRFQELNTAAHIAVTDFTEPVDELENAGACKRLLWRMW